MMLFSVVESWPTTFVFTVYFMSLQLAIHDAARFEIRRDVRPDQSSYTTSEDIHNISCQPDEFGNAAREISMIKIVFRKGEKNIASIRQSVEFSSGLIESYSNSDYDVSGHLDENTSRSYLNVTLYKPKEGWYSCIVNFLDVSGDLKEDTADENLIVKKIDHSDKMASIIETNLNKSVSVNNMTFLENKVELPEDKSATILLNEANILAKNATSQEFKALSNKEKMADLEQNREDQGKEMQTLVNRIEMLESILGIESINETKLNKTVSVNKMTFLENKVKFLENKSASLEERATFLLNEINILAKNAAPQEIKVLSDIGKMADLEQNREDQGQEMQSLVNTVEMLESRLGTAEAQMKSLISRLENNVHSTDENVVQSKQFNETLAHLAAIITQSQEMKLKAVNANIANSIQETVEEIELEQTRKVVLVCYFSCFGFVLMWYYFSVN